ncbi:TPA: TRAP transporter substrate-binding protein [Kluyvera cryocrescens]|uniref:TRAP transporter substrate-binding protein n=1 Tax=Kluyvera cryocrescens TaxID=580 RepID=UPI00155E65D9|nr:TRAP transporter substrate-binding protein [Kluyvera cryocrescens]MCX2866881.1 TRAP transporter substrate-binding protein [Kluyvera cryocrescens]MDU5685166.1 TRAP transporter substrate-binding protein [Kluyvera cryocrescens]MEB6633827.1 TRAP transporter substrate-binding protein [Kluyvera cryocrescens]MEB7713999.1 TRAP transporter substrate-binding protein [Kluyvera cryocrescens]HAT1572796.1 TRAP transporter substrate-binding protein [Kluyvera cryocrescens]
MLRRKLAVSVLSFSLLMGSAAAMAKTVFIASDVHPADYPTTAAVIHMGEKLSAQTDGRLSIRMFPSGQMGDESTTLEKTRAGAIDILRVSMSPVGGILPQVSVFNMPFVFRDMDHQHKVLDGDVGTKLAQEISDSNLGLVFLGWMDAGSRSLITKKPVTTLDDLKGVKIRLQNNPIGLDTFKALGANPIVLPVGDVFASLQTGVIDAAENNEPTFDTENYVVAGTKYFDLTEHFMIPEVLAFSKRKWSKLSPEDQTLIMKLAKEAQAEERVLWADYVEKSKQRLQSQGVKFLPVDKKPFIEATAPVREKYGKQFSTLMQEIQNTK